MIGKYFGFACEMRLLKPQEIFQAGDNQIQVIAIVHAGRVCSFILRKKPIRKYTRRKRYFRQEHVLTW